MAKLKTLKDIEKEFYEMGQDGNFLNCLYACRREAKRHITKLCKDVNLDEKTIKPGCYKQNGIFSFWCEEPKDERNTMTMATVAWIKHFFNLE